MLQLQTEESIEGYARCRKETRKLIRTKKKRVWTKEIERDHPKPGSQEFYRAITFEKKGFKAKSIPTLRNDQGHLILKEEELTEEWRWYFKDLLSIKPEKVHKEETYITADLPVEEPSLQETKRALNKLKNSKAPGSAELLKYDGNGLHLQIHKL